MYQTILGATIERKLERRNALGQITKFDNDRARRKVHNYTVYLVKVTQCSTSHHRRNPSLDNFPGHPISIDSILTVEDRQQRPAQIGSDDQRSSGEWRRLRSNSSTFFVGCPIRTVIGRPAARIHEVGRVSVPKKKEVFSKMVF